MFLVRPHVDLVSSAAALGANHFVSEVRNFGVGRVARYVNQGLVSARIVETGRDELMHAQLMSSFEPVSLLRLYKIAHSDRRLSPAHGRVPACYGDHRRFGLRRSTRSRPLPFLRSPVRTHGFSRDGWREPSSSASGWVLDQFVLE